MNSAAFDQVRSFIVRETGVSVKKVAMDAALEADLGISGDDAVELILAFARVFHVDLSAFNIETCFSPEGDSILPAIIRSFTGRKMKRQKELTVANLTEAVITGKLQIR